MNELTIPMTLAEKLIWQELREQRRLLEELREEKAGESIEEISLQKAARLLRVGTEKILSAVHAGKLRAITYRDKNKMKRFRFRVADIREYQRNRSTRTNEDVEVIESAEAIAKKIFGSKNV